MTPKITNRSPGASVSPLVKLGHPIVGELLKLFWIALALQVLLSLFSYSPKDPSWTTWSSTTQFQNWLGRLGSVTADCLIQTFGLASFSIAFLMALVGFRRLPREQSKPETSASYETLALSVVFLLALSSLVHAVVPTKAMAWHMKNPGGFVGRLIFDGCAFISGRVGAVALPVLFTLASSILLFRWKPITHTLQFFQSLKKNIDDKRLALFTALKEKIKLPKWKKTTSASNLTAASSPAAQVKNDASAAALAPAPTVNPNVLKEASQPTEKKADTAGITMPISNVAPEADEEISKMVSTKVPRAIKEPQTKLPKISRTFQLPGVDLLSGRAESKVKTIDRNWYIEKGNILVQKLKDFGVEGEVVNISPGPVITVYEFKPASGVKIKEIANLSDDLTLALSVLSVRIVAPIPGKPVVGIEIPSPHREMVFFKDMIQETQFYSNEVRIPIVLGRLASGEPVVAGLAAMPHLLVAGSTGTGKSVFINTLISSLLYRYTPQQLKLILVDPKMVELSIYEGIPHLLLPVVVDSRKAALALRWTVDEMERRYSLMHQFGVRHVDTYNEKLAEMGQAEGTEETPFLPYIVVVIDEYADLMSVVPKDVELSIARLAQKARASGIHLVLATQRPSTDVVTGTIKANFPSRISFRVASSVDSKTILDRTGADRLLGNGDMLFHSAGFTTLKRMQGAFISDSDLEHVVEFLKTQGEPEYDERILQEDQLELSDASGSGADDEEGRLLDAAIRLVTEKGEASISLIQRHLKIGYNRAATLMEQLEARGVVAPATSDSKRRAVLVGS